MGRARLASLPAACGGQGGVRRLRGAQVAEGADNNEEIDTEIFEFTGSYAESRRAAPPVDHASLAFSPWQYPAAE